MTSRAGPVQDSTGQIVKAKDTRATIEAWLNDKDTQMRLRRILPSVVAADRFVQVALASLSRKRALLACTQQSLMRCMVQAASVGLEIDTGLGHAYLVPFRDKDSGQMQCTLILGYKGLVQLLYRSAAVSNVSAYVVRDGDEFEWEFGLVPKLRHRPAREPLDEAVLGEKLTHVYAIIRMKDGSTLFDVMARKEVDSVRARSRAATSGPWVTDYPEMAKKTVCRRLTKLAPMSVEDQRIVVADEMADAGLAQTDAFGPSPEWPEVADEPDEKQLPPPRHAPAEAEVVVPPQPVREQARAALASLLPDKSKWQQWVSLNVPALAAKRLDELGDADWAQVLAAVARASGVGPTPEVPVVSTVAAPSVAQVAASVARDRQGDSP